MNSLFLSVVAQIALDLILTQKSGANAPPFPTFSNLKFEVKVVILSTPPSCDGSRGTGSANRVDRVPLPGGTAHLIEVRSYAASPRESDHSDPHGSAPH